MELGDAGHGDRPGATADETLGFSYGIGGGPVFFPVNQSIHGEFRKVDGFRCGSRKIGSFNHQTWGYHLENGGFEGLWI